MHSRYALIITKFMQQPISKMYILLNVKSSYKLFLFRKRRWLTYRCGIDRKSNCFDIFFREKMSHTILLVQPAAKPESRTYTDYESVNECMEVKHLGMKF